MTLIITDNKNIEVDGQKVTLEELQKLRENAQKKVIQIAPNKFKLLEKMLG